MKRQRFYGWLLVGLVLVGLSCNPLELVSKTTGGTTPAGSGVTSSTVAENPPTTQKTSSAKSVESSASAASASQASSQPLKGKVGQRLVGERLAITVTKAELNKGTADVKPSEGSVFVVVYFVLENSSKDRISFYPDSFEIVDSNGRLVSNNWLDFLKDQLEQGQYAPGGKTTATIGFEVSQKSKGFHLLVDQGTDEPLDVDLGF